MQERIYTTLLLEEHFCVNRYWQVKCNWSIACPYDNNRLKKYALVIITENRSTCKSSFFELQQLSYLVTNITLQIYRMWPRISWLYHNFHLFHSSNTNMKAITELANLRDARLVKGRIEVNVLNHLDANQWFCTRYGIKNQNLKIHIRTENLTLCYISFQVPTCSTIFPIKQKL